MSNTGTIVGFEAHPSSGIALLLIKNDAGEVIRIPCENGPTVRALDAMFEVIRPGHQIDVEAILGKRVTYSVADYGVLEWIDEG